MEKSCPVPLNPTTCGDPVALSVIVRVPVLDPLAVGSKNTPIEQLAFTARLLPQLLRTPKSDGLAVTLVMLTDTVP